MRVGWNNRSTTPTYTTGRRFGWMKRLCAINSPVGQPDRLTRWVDEAVIIVWPALRHHPFTIYTCLLALLVEKIIEFNPTSPKALTCWISQILNIYFTCIEYLWSVKSGNHIGPKKKVVSALNRLFPRKMSYIPVFNYRKYWTEVHRIFMQCDVARSLPMNFLKIRMTIFQSVSECHGDE